MTFKVFDQLLNVNGNGITSYEELIREISGTLIQKEQIEKIILGEPFYEGYSRITVINGEVFPDYVVDKNSIIVLESERINHPEINYWEKVRTHKVFSPYPNFEKEYSTVYTCNFERLNNAWKHAAINYYRQCQKFFTETPDYYSLAYPSNSRKSNTRIMDGFTNNLKRYSSYEEISEAYKCKFDGNVIEFAERRWQTELSRIQTFLHDTISFLESSIKPEVNTLKCS